MSQKSPNSKQAKRNTAQFERQKAKFLAQPVLKESDLEYQFRLYLQRMNYSDNMPEDQYKQLKQAFYGSAGQLLDLLVQYNELPEDMAARQMEKLYEDCSTFWHQQIDELGL